MTISLSSSQVVMVPHCLIPKDSAWHLHPFPRHAAEPCEGNEEMALDFQLQKGIAWTCVCELCWKPAYSTTEINTSSFQEWPWFLYPWKYSLPLCRILLQWCKHQRIKALHSVSDHECTLIALVFLICAVFEEAIKTQWLLQQAAQK